MGNEENKVFYAIPFVIMLKNFTEHPDDPFNVKKVEKFFRLRKFQIPEWGKGLFIKWVCESGLLWYVMKEIEAIIEKQIMIIAYEKRMREQAIEELKQKIAALEKQDKGKVMPPALMNYQIPICCEGQRCDICDNNMR